MASSTALPRREIRRTGVHLTRLGFGAAPIAGLYQAVDETTSRATIDAAWEGGIRYFDTAPHYGLGLSERRLGEALRDRPRDDVVVSSKVGRLLVPRTPPVARDDELFDVPGDLTAFCAHWRRRCSGPVSIVSMSCTSTTPTSTGARRRRKRCLRSSNCARPASSARSAWA